MACKLTGINEVISILNSKLIVASKLDSYTWDLRLVRPEEVELFVKEHGVEYAQQFSKDICVVATFRIREDEAHYILFSSVLATPTEFSYAGFTWNKPQWGFLEEIFASVCSSVNNSNLQIKENQMSTAKQINDYRFQTRLGFEVLGKRLQYRARGNDTWKEARWCDWDWVTYEYRLKPEKETVEVNVPLVAALGRLTGAVYWIAQEHLPQYNKVDYIPIKRFITIDKQRHAVIDKELE